MDRDPFSFWTPLDLDKSVETGSHRPICGIISTEDMDLDNEIISEAGSTYSPMLSAMGKNLSAVDLLDFDRFATRQGWLKYEHFSGECSQCGAGETANIIGVPTIVEKGVQYRDPINGAMKSGTAIWGELFAPGVKKSADDVWSLMQAIKKSGFDRRLGYSIEGAYLPAAKDLPANVRKCLVTNVVVTAKPVNSMAWADMAKALTAGTGITDSAQLTGGAALRRQSLHGAESASIQGGKKKKCDHCDGDCDDASKAFEHLVVCKGLPVNRAKRIVIDIFKIAA